MKSIEYQDKSFAAIKCMDMYGYMNSVLNCMKEIAKKDMPVSEFLARLNERMKDSGFLMLHEYVRVSIESHGQRNKMRSICLEYLDAYLDGETMIKNRFSIRGSYMYEHRGKLPVYARSLAKRQPMMLYIDAKWFAKAIEDMQVYFGSQIRYWLKYA